MSWTHDTADGGLRLRRFTLERAGRRIPGVAWSRPGDAGPRPLVLVGHGGSQNKESSAVTDVAYPLVRERGWVVAAIDGPVHGERRADGEREGAKVIGDFRARWNERPSIDEMVDDWRAAIDFLTQQPEVDAQAVGWFGISMGTAYGLPVCASEPRLRAALLGMWGTSHAHGEVMTFHARRVRCPVLFQRQRDDARFTPAGQEELFAALGSRDKELRVYEGTHVNPAGVQLQEGLDFLVRHLDGTRP
jgi:dienelactone hydrolase